MLNTESQLWFVQDAIMPGCVSLLPQYSPVILITQGPCEIRTGRQGKLANWLAKGHLGNGAWGFLQHAMHCSGINCAEFSLDMLSFNNSRTSAQHERAAWHLPRGPLDWAALATNASGEVGTSGHDCSLQEPVA